MNTRLQVEHPVTEMITGVDIVEQMIRIAAGHTLSPRTQAEVKLNGWAIESRVYAEDPLRGFLPSIGTLKRYVEPSGEGVRVDSGVVEGGEISIHYDPMISKLITYGATRDEALAHMRKALDGYVIRGLTHNINFLRSLCDHPRFIAGKLTTNFIPEEYPQGYKGAKLTKDDVLALVASAVIVYAQMLRQQTSISGKQRTFDADAYVASTLSKLVVGFGAGASEAQSFDVSVRTSGAQGQLSMDIVGQNNAEHGGVSKRGVVVESSYKRGDHVFSSKVDGRDYTLQVVASSDGSPKLTLSFAGSSFPLEIRSPRQSELLKYMPLKEVLDTSKLVVSPMPGAVFSVKVKVGDEVAPGQEVAVVEAMKMQNALRATNAGKVKAVHVKKGQTVVADQVLIELE